MTPFVPSLGALVLVQKKLNIDFRTLEHNSVCAGGGAVEAALSVYLDDFARTLVHRTIQI